MGGEIRAGTRKCHGESPQNKTLRRRSLIAPTRGATLKLESILAPTEERLIAPTRGATLKPGYPAHGAHRESASHRPDKGRDIEAYPATADPIAAAVSSPRPGARH